MGSKEERLSYSIAFISKSWITLKNMEVKRRVKTTVKMILVAATTIFCVSMMNKLYYGC
jgi:hypothetical protein